MATRVEPLTRADAAWLHAEAPTNPFVITSLGLLDRPVAPERMIRMLGARLHLHPRMRQIVHEPLLPGGVPRWIEAPEFDLRAHIHHAGLPAPGGRAELAEFVSGLAGLPLPFTRPFWELHLIDRPDGGGAIVSRFHHSMGDGQAMVKMLLSLTDPTPGGWRRHLRPQLREAAGFDPLAALGAAVHAASAVREAPAAVRQGLELAGSLARLTLLDPDPPTPLRGHLSQVKRVSWSDPLPLQTVTRVARRAGATVNDVLVSSIAGGLGSYLQARGVATAGLRLRAMVPVNLRPADDTGMTENRFSLVFLELPVGLRDAGERLLRVRHEMDRIKASNEPAVGWLMLQSLGLLPARLEQLGSQFYADKASLVLTNVIGPRRPVYVCGSRLREMTFWEPEAGGLGVGVSIFSYAGGVSIGAIADANLVPDPEQITRGCEAAFRDLLEAS